MSSDPIIHGMFRSLHERLYMMEEVCVAKDPVQRTESTGNKYDELLNCIQTLESRMTALESSILDLKSTSTNATEKVHVNCIGKESPELWVKAMKDLEIVLPPKEKNPVKASSMEQEDVVVEDEIEVVEEEEIEVVEEEEVEVVEEEEEEDGIEVEEIIFKNKKYFKDPENNVYGVDEDENPTPDPIGVWDTGRQRVLFKRIA